MKICSYVIVDNLLRTVDYYAKPAAQIEIHSCAKPFQLIPLFLLGLDYVYHFSDEELAIMMSSSLGQENQVKVISNLLKKVNITPNDLFLDAVAPVGYKAYARWKKVCARKSILFHPCVGNHIAMCLAQRALSGSTFGYLSVDSPVQKMITSVIRDFCGKEILLAGTDNCGAPCFSMPLENLATGYYQFKTGCAIFSQQGYNRAIKRIRTAAYHFPSLLEGEKCLSTAVSRQNGLFGKTGINTTFAVCVDKKDCAISLYSENGNWADVAYTIKRLLLAMGCASRHLCLELDDIITMSESDSLF